MIHLDRNHHSPIQNHSNILSSWSNIDYHQDPSSLPVHHDPSSSSSSSATVSQPPTSHVSRPSSPASPTADGKSTSPVRDRSSSLSPVPSTPHIPPGNKSLPASAGHRPDNTSVNGRASKNDVPSRSSTPLSELSPPPDNDGPGEGEGFTTPVDSNKLGSEELPRNKPHSSRSQSARRGSQASMPNHMPPPPTKEDSHSSFGRPSSSTPPRSAPSNQSSQPNQNGHPSRSHSVDLNATPSGLKNSPSVPPSPFRAPSNPPSSSKPNEKILAILELNVELLR